jgi:hypothetical protein
MTATEGLRQTCCRCLTTVGVLPTGETRAYLTEHLPDGRRFHECFDTAGCTARREARVA